MRNETGKTYPDYYDMTEAERSKVHDYFCSHTDVLFEENSRNRTSLITEKQYFNSTCEWKSKYYTNDYNLRFFFFLAVGPNHDKVVGKTQIFDTQSFYLSKENESVLKQNNKTSVEFKRLYDYRQFFKVFFDENLNGANITWIGMFHFDKVNKTMYNNWFLDAKEYLADFLTSGNLIMVWETKDAGHNNITIGYEEYINRVGISLEKQRRIGVKAEKTIFGIPIDYQDVEVDIIKFHKIFEFIDKIKNTLGPLRKHDKKAVFEIPLEIEYNQ